MAISVNPPPQPRYPPKIANNEPVREYFDNLNRVILQLWRRTGGGEDAVDSTEQSLTSTSSRVSRNAARIDALEFIRFRVVNVTSDYTAAPFEIVVCNNTTPITVTLPTDALLDDQIHVKRKQDAAKVTVSGSIDGKTSRVINIKNWSDFYVFDGSEYAVI